MSNIVLSSKNRIDAAGATFYGNEDVALPLNNLRDPIFSKVWRYTPGTNADGNTAKFQFVLTPVARAGHAAFARHNMGEGAQIRVRAGTARLDVDFTDDDLTSPYLTFGGGTNGTRTNEYGVMEAKACPRYEHDRRYFENGFKYSEDLSQTSAWVTASYGAKIYADGQTVSFGFLPAASIGTYDGAMFYQEMQLYADTYEVKAQVRLVEGNGDFSFRATASAQHFGSLHTATSEWQWFSDSIVVAAAAANGNAAFYKRTAAGVLQIRKLQIRRGASNGKYRKTTSQRLYQRIGVITEAAATNSILRSAELDNAAWNKAGATVTANTNVAPDGATAMDRVTVAAAGQYIFQDITAGGTTARALSFYFRPDASTANDAILQMEWKTGGVVQYLQMRFNPQTGAFISSAAVGGATLRAGGIKDCGGGFYRAYVIGVGTDAANTQVSSLLIVNSIAHVAAWGFQNESTYVTSYIPTTTAAVTRTVDTAIVEAATWVPYVWNASEGAVYHEAMADDIPADSASRMLSALLASSAGTNQFWSRLFSSVSATAPLVDLLVYEAASLNVNTADASVSVASVVRHAFRYRANDYAASVSGAAVQTDTSAGVPAVTSIDLMNSSTATAYLRRVTFWPTGKSNTELQSLSTSGPSAIDYDSGWDDVLQMSFAGDVPSDWGKVYPIIKTFAERAIEWVRVQLYDPAKVSSSYPFEIGRAFIGKLTLQPARNAEYGLGNGWNERTTFTQAEDGRKFFTERSRIREVAFAFPLLTHAEAAKLHEMQGSGGIVEETLYLPDPDDEAECQRYGFVGLMSQLDPLRYPMFATRSAAIQMAEKR